MTFSNISLNKMTSRIIAVNSELQFKKNKQESIPERCQPPTCKLYMFHNEQVWKCPGGPCTMRSKLDKFEYVWGSLYSEIQVEQVWTCVGRGWLQGNAGPWPEGGQGKAREVLVQRGPGARGQGPLLGLVWIYRWKEGSWILKIEMHSRDRLSLALGLWNEYFCGKYCFVNPFMHLLRLSITVIYFYHYRVQPYPCLLQMHKFKNK